MYFVWHNDMFIIIITFVILLANSCSVLLTQYCAGDKIEKNEMGVVCSSVGEWRVKGFGGETWGKVTTGKTQA
jgi:hypothetical protein